MPRIAFGRNKASDSYVIELASVFTWDTDDEAEYEEESGIATCSDSVWRFSHVHSRAVTAGLNVLRPVLTVAMDMPTVPNMEMMRSIPSRAWLVQVHLRPAISDVIIQAINLLLATMCPMTFSSDFVIRQEVSTCHAHDYVHSPRQERRVFGRWSWGLWQWERSCQWSVIFLKLWPLTIQGLIKAFTTRREKHKPSVWTGTCVHRSNSNSTHQSSFGNSAPYAGPEQPYRCSASPFIRFRPVNIPPVGVGTSRDAEEGHLLAQVMASTFIGGASSWTPNKSPIRFRWATGAQHWLLGVGLQAFLESHKKCIGNAPTV
jgi:hypothetical protein